ncbi:MAG: ChaN family lipoprotein [Nitrospiraceae bacterium]
MMIPGRQCGDSYTLFVHLALCTVLAWVPACSPASIAGESASISGSIASAIETLDEWSIHETKTHRSISLSALVDQLAKQDVVYLGEEHHNSFHIEAAVKVLNALLENNRRPILAIEMLGWDGQAALERYLTQPTMTREQFLQDSHWQQSWGGAYEDYEPLIMFAREHRLPMRALNPPRPLVRRVVKQGLAGALVDPEMDQWGMRSESFVDDAAYREKILHQLQQCHGGGSERDYQTMYEASMFRDEGMAKSIVEALRAFHVGNGSPEGPIVSYTGGGHIQYNLPVPNRVLKRVSTVKQLTIYLASVDKTRPEDIREMLRDGVADYVWLTPVSAQGPPRRCR